VEGWSNFFFLKKKERECKMNCAVCGKEVSENRCYECYKSKCLDCDNFDKETKRKHDISRCLNCDVIKSCVNCHFYICSKECQEKFNQKVEEIFRKRHSNLIGKSLIVDPAVGDEYEIARISARMRIEAELSRKVRIQELQENIKRLGLVIPELGLEKTAEHLMVLNERQAGSNTVDVMIKGKLYTVYYSGAVEETKGYGYYWVRVEGGWQEVRADEFTPEFIPDEKMRFPEYGDVEGSPAISLVEHGVEHL